jgi:hypothetical protein
MKLKKTIIISLVLLIIIVGSIGMIWSLQHSLNYRWEKGKIYTFAVESNDKITIESTGPISHKQEIDTTTRTQFSIKIIEAYRDGSADAILFIDKFNVTGSSMFANNVTFATIDDLPKESLKSKISIDKKGKFRFYEMFYLLYGERNTILVSIDLGEKRASATVSDQNTKVEVYAEFDRESGEVKAGYSVENLEETKKTKTLRESYNQINIIPVSFLEMLELPEGSFSEGDRITSKISNYEITLDVMSIKKGIATIKNIVKTLESDGSGMDDMGDVSVDVDSEDDENDFSFDFDSDFNNDFDEDFDEDMEANMNPTDMLKMNGDFTYKFDMNKGMLKSIEGTMKTSSEMKNPMMSFNVNTISKLKMKLINK